MSKNQKKILNDLSKIFEKKSLKPSDSTSSLKHFDSIIILQIINLCNLNYKKKIDGSEILKCNKIIYIINLIEIK